jgi:uncharacterized membrane protein YhhN
MRLKQLLLIIFVCLSVADLLAVTVPFPTLEWICKPLLMPVLLLHFLQERSDTKGFHRYIAWGIFFSTFGDSFLLKGDEELFFMLGLGSFLVAHIFYIIGFRKLYQPPAGKATAMSLSGNFPLAMALLAYGVLLYSALYPKLDAVLKVAVLVYASAITLMALSCLALRPQLSKQVFSPLMVGASLFVLSDSCIAVNRFLMPLPYSGLIIMSTYIVAQYLIAKGASAVEG